MGEEDHRWTSGVPVDWHEGDGPSPYYNPPEGLSVFADIDLRAGSPYEFAQVVVWRQDETGKLFGAADSGCSCPIPFAGLTLEGMAEITKASDLDPLFAYLGGSERSDPQRISLFKTKVASALLGR